MPKLRVLSGAGILQIFFSFGFIMVSQRGSHIKLQRILPSGRQTLTIPNHTTLDKGTVKAIYRQAMRYITEEDLHPHFYSD